MNNKKIFLSAFIGFILIFNFFNFNITYAEPSNSFVIGIHTDALEADNYRGGGSCNWFWRVC